MPELTDEQYQALLQAAGAGEVMPDLSSPKPVIPQVRIAEEPIGNRYAIKAWGAKTRQEFDVECPSGQWCRAHALTMEDAMSLGMLDSLDMFTSTLMGPVLDSDPKESDAERNAGILEGLKDPTKRASFFGTVNRIVAHCVVNPTVVLEDPGDLPEGTVFANDIPFADKMHIFRAVFAGGERNATMTTFREGQTGELESVPDGDGISDAPQ